MPNRRLLTPATAAVLLAAASLTACGGDDTTADASAPAPAAATSADDRPAEATARLSFAELAERAIPEIKNGAMLLDVRTKEEWDEGHAAPAEHLPLADIEAGKRPDGPKDAAIYITCRSGNRAGIAAEILRADGYTNVVNIGGLDDWKAAGGDVTS